MIVDLAIKFIINSIDLSGPVDPITIQKLFEAELNPTIKSKLSEAVFEWYGYFNKHTNPINYYRFMLYNE